MPENDQALIERFIRLFPGYDKGHGFGNGHKGTKYNNDKNKQEFDKGVKGTIGWERGGATYQDFVSHLNEGVMLGIGPIREDGKTWRGELDLDTGTDGKYEFDYAAELEKVKRSGLPLVCSRTKSSGIRAIVFFTEPVEAEAVIRILKSWRAQLGWGDNEIFPKQAQLAKDEDYPSWTFIPYGPTYGVFAEQCGMNEYGNPLTLSEYVDLAESRRISREQLLAYDSREHAGAGVKENGKGRQRGLWVQEDTEEDTIKSLFWNGPICLYHIAQHRSRDYQHYFLLNCAAFFKRKYPENWDKALEWVNFHVLSPVGDSQKLLDLIKTVKNKEYDYTCKNEPICSHCNAGACRRQPFGVGSGGNSGAHRELGITIVNSVPRRFIVNLGELRMRVDERELMNLGAYREKCLAIGADFPNIMKREEWDGIIRRGLEEATIVDPPEIMRTNVAEIETLQMYFSIHIPQQVRSGGEEYLAGKKGDLVRVRVAERMVYFKWQGLLSYCRRALSMRDRELERLRVFVTSVGKENSRVEGREWYRSTLSISFMIFGQEVVTKWLGDDVVRGILEADGGKVVYLWPGKSGPENPAE